MTFQRTTAINKIATLKRFVRGVQGGTSAGKTYGIIPLLIHFCTLEKLDGSIVSESIPHLRRGAMKDFVNIMESTGRMVHSRWNKSNSKYTFANGSTIEFFSVQDASKLRGGRRDFLYINECNNIRFEAYNELASRTKQFIYLDWNPVSPFWFHEELMRDNDVDYLTINYEDNEACPVSARNFILKAKAKAETSEYWSNWYNVYGLGQVGKLQDVIFEFNTIDSIPKDAELLGYGLDWGFTNDPTSVIALYKHDKTIIADELIYSTNLTNSDIYTKLVELNISKSAVIIADSAEPKSIEDMQRFGYNNIEGATKGADSVRNGIDKLRQHELLVTINSINLIKELRMYSWDKDKNGKLTGKPIDSNNHAIDALRYAGSKLLNNNTNYVIL